jgi:hypothetical protein
MTGRTVSCVLKVFGSNVFRVADVLPGARGPQHVHELLIPLVLVYRHSGLNLLKMKAWLSRR